MALLFDFTLKPLFEAVDMSKFKNGRVHFRNSRMKGLNVDKEAIFSIFNKVQKI